MEDVIGRKVFVGDTVVFSHLGHTDRLIVGKVIGFTTMKIRIEYSTKDWSVDECLKFPTQIARV